MGRIRTTPEWSGADDNDVLSLGLFPGTYLEFTMDDRYVFFIFVIDIVISIILT